MTNQIGTCEVLNQGTELHCQFSDPEHIVTIQEHYFRGVVSDGNMVVTGFRDLGLIFFLGVFFGIFLFAVIWAWSER